MELKILIKPTDYVFYNDGRIDYSYASNVQYGDGEMLNRLPEKELVNECSRRWNVFKKFPTPSNYSKLSLAQDLARAKGFSVSFELNESPVKSETFSQREF